MIRDELTGETRREKDKYVFEGESYRMVEGRRRGGRRGEGEVKGRAAWMPWAGFGRGERTSTTLLSARDAIHHSPDHVDPRTVLQLFSAGARDDGFCDSLHARHIELAKPEFLETG